MNKKIYLVMIRKKLQGLEIAPFALLFVSSSLEKKGYSPKILDIAPAQIDETVKEIVAEKPLFVGFSVLTGLPIKYSVEMSKKIKALSKIPIVWGGVHPTIVPEQTLKEEFVDFVVHGEGEETISELAKAIAGNGDFSKILGLGFKKNGKIVLNPERQMEKNLDKYRINFDKADMARYIIEETKRTGSKQEKVRRLGFIASRGCPHNCAFCYNLVFNRRRWRGQSAEIVIEDVLKLKKKYGINEVVFWDDNFFADKKRAFEILEGIGMQSGIEIRIDYVDEETARRLKELKVTYLLIGAESGSNRMLKLMNKGFTAEQMLEKIKILAKYHIPAQYSFILGLPTETEEELFKTIDFMHDIYKIHKEANFTVGNFNPYPGTDMFKLALNQGFKLPANTEEWSLVDRWKNTTTLPWANKKTCLNLRHMFSMLAWKNPLLNKWLEFRISRKMLGFNLDLSAFIVVKRFLNKLRS